MTRLLLTVLASVCLALSARAAELSYPGQTEGDFTLSQFRFDSGETLAGLRLHYMTIGTLKRDAKGHATNAVLVLHGTGGSGRQFLQPQFAGVLFKPGGVLDPAKYFIILADDIGHGGSSKPSGGLHAKFPHYDYADMVRGEQALVMDGLKVDHLRVIIGTSMGCMHAFLWGERFPAAMDALFPLACAPVQIAGRNRLWRQMIIDGIKSDPAWDGGEYRQEPKEALRLAADVLRIAGSAPLQDQKSMPTRDAADAALAAFLKVQLARLDANDLLYQAAASRDYDPSLALDTIKAQLVWINSGDDFINPPELGIAEREVSRIPHGRYILIPASGQTHGHGSHTWAVLWQAYLAQLLDATAKP